MGEQDLMRMHVEAAFTHDSRGRMRTVNEPGGTVAPQFFLGRTSEGNLWRFRHDIGGDLVQELETLCNREPVGDEAMLPPNRSLAYKRLLAHHAPIHKVWTGPAYRFPAEVPASVRTVLVTSKNADVLRPYFEEWIDDASDGQPFLALTKNGRAVSVCSSVRMTAEAHEAGVETHRDFRGRGYAAHVTSAWASAVRQIGRIPLYSTSWQNAASQTVAKKLGLVRYGSTLHIT